MSIVAEAFLAFILMKFSKEETMRFKKMRRISIVIKIVGVSLFLLGVLLSFYKYLPQQQDNKKPANVQQVFVNFIFSADYFCYYFRIPTSPRHPIQQHSFNAAGCLDALFVTVELLNKSTNSDSPPHLRRPNPASFIHNAAGVPGTALLVAVEQSGKSTDSRWCLTSNRRPYYCQSRH